MRRFVLTPVILLAASAALAAPASNAPPRPVGTPPSAASLRPALGRTAALANASGAKAASPRKSAAVASWAAGAATQVQVLNLGGIQATVDPVRGVVMVEPDGAVAKSLAFTKSGAQPADTARAFVASQKSLYRLQNPAAELAVEDVTADGFNMTHVVFTQQHAGIPFWGRELRAHFGPGGELKSLNGHVNPTPDATVPTAPAISADQAEAAGRAALEAEGHAWELSEEMAARLGIVTHVPQLLYWQADEQAPVELVWQVELRPNVVEWYRLFVSATDGSVRDRYLATAQDGPATATATNALGRSVTLNTYQLGSDYHLIDASKPMFVAGQSASQLLNDPKGAIVTWDLRNKDLTREASIFSVTSGNNRWSDGVAVSAHDYGGVAYNYFRTKHERNSIDGKGGSIISLIHVTDKGKGLDNAYWNGAAMIYGDGNTAFFPLVRGLDVAAHEMSHGVIQHTADLEYKNQSGALNESFADVFGMLVDDDDFRIGEDVVKSSSFPSGALRSMEDPHNGGSSLNDRGWQPRTMSEFLNLDQTQDNGGVHINSGIPNFAAYKVAAAIGREKTGRIYYRALANYLGKQSTFVDCRLALERAAKDLHGDNSAELTAVQRAFNEVGIMASGGTKPPEEAPVNTGAQYVLVVGGDGKLYRTTPAFSSFAQISQRTINTRSGRPVATDSAGSVILFVDSGGNLVGTTPSGQGETVLLSTDDSGGFNSVAVSPSGRFISLTPAVQANVIFVLDLVGEDVKAITLYRPTTGQGALQDVVRYADAMTWMDDAYLAYDNLNQVDTPGGTRSFWDISIVDTSRLFAENSVQFYPLLAPVEGVTVANPMVATRNSSLLAFDWLDESTGAVKVMGADLYSGNAGVIFDNGGPFEQFLNFGYPDFSPDDRTLLFSSVDDEYNLVLATIPLGADRISAAGAPQAVSYGIRGLWFATGQQLPQVDPLLKILTEKDYSTGAVDVNRDRVLDAADVGIPQ